ncbi:MAG TPA: hypothetical protein VFU86_19840 [Terriglobales bacterium]|nr:hypothetical protein [Terriglobales bacterium]
MTFKEEISIWFFIGISLLVNGVLITGAGLYEWFIQPPAHPVVLYNLHANAWWGAILLALGIFYCWHFWPEHHRAEVPVRER